MKAIPTPPPPPPGSLRFAELYARFRDELLEAFHRLRVFGPDAEDAVQFVLEKVWQNVATFPQEPSAARLRMLSIAAQVAQAARRRNARRARHHAGANPELVPNDIDEATVVRWFHLVECVTGLEQPCRDVFIEHDIEGHSTKSIAKAMNTSESTVRSWLSRARAHLREQLGKDEEPKSKRGTVIPLFGAGLGLTDLDRAVLSAVFRAEGRQPLVGGPSDPPPPPPPPRDPPSGTPKTLALPLAFTPKIVAAILGSLITFPVAIAIALLFGPPRERPELAHDGLYVPPICLPADPAPVTLPESAPPTASTTNNGPRSTHSPRAAAPLDADALARARKNLPKFSVSEPKMK